MRVLNIYTRNISYKTYINIIVLKVHIFQKDAYLFSDKISGVMNNVNEKSQGMASLLFSSPYFEHCRVFSESEINLIRMF